MGRSGTSYLTGFLASCGVDIGSDLLPPGEANPLGFFEDRDVVEFHRGILKRLRGSEEWDDTAGELIPACDLTPEERSRAQLILEKLAKPGVWGWKDPRTLHFVDFWLQQLPQAKLIVPLRHPLEVLYSYLKRVATLHHLKDVTCIFRAYAEYHERIAAVIRTRGANSLVLYTPNAFTDADALNRTLREFLQVPAGTWRHSQLTFEGSRFTSLIIDGQAAGFFHALYPEAGAAFDELNRRAHFRFVPADTSRERIDLWSHVSEACRQTHNFVPAEDWLPLLLDLCRPPGSSGYFKLRAGILARHIEATRFYQAQAELKDIEITSSSKMIKEQADWILQLEEGKQFVQSQLEFQRAEMASLNAIVREQREWIAQLEEAKTFAQSQMECYVKELESLNSIIRDQAPQNS